MKSRHCRWLENLRRISSKFVMADNPVGGSCAPRQKIAGCCAYQGDNRERRPRSVMHVVIDLDRRCAQSVDPGIGPIPDGIGHRSQGARRAQTQTAHMQIPFLDNRAWVGGQHRRISSTNRVNGTFDRIMPSAAFAHSRWQVLLLVGLRSRRRSATSPLQLDLSLVKKVLSALVAWEEGGRGEGYAVPFHQD